MNRRALLALLGILTGEPLVFSNPIAGGDVLVRPALRSPNFVHNISGWSINRDGSAEFQNLLARGTINLGTGPDIVLDSVAGTITIFSALGHKILVLDNVGLRLFQDIGGGGLVGSLQPDDILLIDPANPANLFEVLPTAPGIDIQLWGVSIGRGMPPGTSYQLINGAGSSDSARAAGVNTDMVITPTVDNTRLYEVTFKSQFNVGTTGVVYAIDLSEGGTVGNNDGTAIDRLLRINASECAVGAATLSRTASVLYKPSTSGSKTLRVRNDVGSGGTITLASDNTAGIGSRSLKIVDIGPQ